MSNRTDFDNQAREFLEWMRSQPADAIQARLERELNDAFVAGQEQQERGDRDEAEAWGHVYCGDLRRYEPPEPTKVLRLKRGEFKVDGGALETTIDIEPGLYDSVLVDRFDGGDPVEMYIDPPVRVVGKGDTVRLEGALVAALKALA